MNIKLFYINLISHFLNNEISLSEFEERYLRTFENANGADDALFEQLDWLFAKIDCYTNDDEEIKRDPIFNINEEQLRESASEVLEYLENLK